MGGGEGVFTYCRYCMSAYVHPQLAVVLAVVLMMEKHIRDVCLQIKHLKLIV